MTDDEPRELILSDVQVMRMLGVPFGAFMGIFVGLLGCGFGGLLGLPLGPCALLTGLIGLLAGGLGGGAISGITYGGLMAVFFSVMRPERQLVQWPDGEHPRVVGPGSHFVGRKPVAGHAWLTDRRLRFVSHAAHTPVHEVSWTLDQILDARTAKSLGLIENRLVLSLADGTEEILLLAEPAEWAAELAAIQLAG
jgi:hypothetical protein